MFNTAFRAAWHSDHAYIEETSSEGSPNHCSNLELNSNGTILCPMWPSADTAYLCGCPYDDKMAVRPQELAPDSPQYLHLGSIPQLSVPGMHIQKQCMATMLSTGGHQALSLNGEYALPGHLPASKTRTSQAAISMI
jgi:hypothetical protein